MSFIVLGKAGHICSQGSKCIGPEFQQDLEFTNLNENVAARRR